MKPGRVCAMLAKLFRSVEQESGRPVTQAFFGRRAWQEFADEMEAGEATVVTLLGVQCSRCIYMPTTEVWAHSFNIRPDAHPFDPNTPRFL